MENVHAIVRSLFLLIATVYINQGTESYENTICETVIRYGLKHAKRDIWTFELNVVSD